MSSRRPPHCRDCGLPVKGHKRPGGVKVCPSPPESSPTAFTNTAPSLPVAPHSTSTLQLSTRRPPHCHDCGLPMKGHKRPGGVKVCPSPPGSSPTAITNTAPSPPIAPQSASTLQLSTRRPPYCRDCGLPMKGHKRPGGVKVCPSPPRSSPTEITNTAPSPPIAPQSANTVQLSTPRPPHIRDCGLPMKGHTRPGGVKVCHSPPRSSPIEITNTAPSRPVTTLSASASQTSSQRLCHYCGFPAKDHEPSGFLVCPIPESSFPAEIEATEHAVPSPPVTPRRWQYSTEKVGLYPTPAPTMDKLSHPVLPTPPPTLPRTRVEPSFVTPDRGPRSRRNPNWEENTPPLQQPFFRAPSFADTTLVDEDGNTVQGSDDRHNEDSDVDDDDESADEKAYAICIYVKRRNIPEICKQAAEMGLTTSVTQSPLDIRRKTEKAGGNTWLMVVGRNTDLVTDLERLLRRGTKGDQEKWVGNRAMSRWD